MELRVKNVGPVSGELSLGRLEEPGLYMVVGDNAGGKTSILRTLAALRDRKLLRTSANVTDGAVEAFLELEPVRVTLRRSSLAAGGMQEPEYAGGDPDDLPNIAEMPAAIDTLIHGDHLKDDESRARRRLGALLAYAPVPLTDETWGQLLRCLEEREFSAVDAEKLTEDLNPKLGRTTSGRLRDAHQLRSLVREERPRDLLTAQEALVNLLQDAARSAEVYAEAASREADRAATRAAEIAASAGVPEQILRSAQRPPEELAAAQAQAIAHRDALAAQAQRAGAMRERLERLRAQHGERPTANSAPVRMAAEALEAATAKALELTFDGNAVRWGADLSEAEHDVREAISQLRRALDNRALLEGQRRWDEVEAELAQPIESPTNEELRAAGEAALDAMAAVETARVAARFQASDAERERWVTRAGRLNTLAADYRAAAKDSWKYLGLAVTESLKLPWLQVDGIEIFLGYVGGKLNDDPEVIAEAESTARRQLAATMSPVAVNRFLLEAVRKATTKIEWRPIGSVERMSTGELHEACMAVMLSRHDQLGGGILLVPWQVPAAMDAETLASLSERLKRAGIIALSERPRRAGDGEGMYLERVAAAEG